MNEERIMQLSEVLTQDVEWAKELLQMKPENAVEALAAKGHDFSVEELEFYGKTLMDLCKSELNESDLDNVAGGWRKVVGQTMITVGSVLLEASIGAAFALIW